MADKDTGDSCHHLLIKMKIMFLFQLERPLKRLKKSNRRFNSTRSPHQYNFGYISDSRTIEAAHRRIDRPSLKYYEVVYACIHGGRKFKSQGKGRRASS